MLTIEQVREWHTVGEASRVLGLSEARCRQLADTGRLESVRLPNGRLIEPGSVRRFLAERQRRRTQRPA